jgi:hypothetical protein
VAVVGLAVQRFGMQHELPASERGDRRGSRDLALSAVKAQSDNTRAAQVAAGDDPDRLCARPRLLPSWPRRDGPPSWRPGYQLAVVYRMRNDLVEEASRRC